MAVEASDRAEVDTARPFRSVREAVAVFGDRILVGESHSRSSNASSAAVASASGNANATAIATSAGKHEISSSSSSTITLSPNPMAESDAEAMPAVVPMYSAPSSPPSLASSPSPTKVRSEERDGDVAGRTIVLSIAKLEAEVSETRQEVAQLRKRSSEMEMAVASLNAQLHRGLSKLAELEADKAAAARRSVGGETDVASAVRSERYWSGDKLGRSESYLPSFSHALSLGELDDDDDGDIIGGRRRKVQKVKPIVPLIGDILFSKRKSTKQNSKGDGLYRGELHSVMG